MNNNLIALMTMGVTADILVSYAHRLPLDAGTITLAQALQKSGIDLDFILVIAGGNKDNLKELCELAYEELVLLAKDEEVSRYVHNNDE